MTSLIGEICHIFCCPPRPSHIVAKFAFLPPTPTYSIVQAANGSERTIIFKPEAGHLSEDAKSKMEVFYTMTKRNSRIACLYIRYDPASDRRSHHSFLQMGSKTSSEYTGIAEVPFTVLFSHGNAVDIGQMAGFLYSLSQRFHVNILVYDYSGYGASSGQTLEGNLYADAEAALIELRERYLCPLDHIVLYGQSIGTAPTVEVATHYKVGGVILHSALMSGLRVVCPGTTRRFCFDPFTNIDKVANIQSPTLVMHGTEDEVIGLHHGKELHARLAYPLEPLWVDGAGHNDIELFAEYAHRLDKFFREDMVSMVTTPSLDTLPHGDQSQHRKSRQHAQNSHPPTVLVAPERQSTINSGMRTIQSVECLSGAELSATSSSVDSICFRTGTDGINSCLAQSSTHNTKDIFAASENQNLIRKLRSESSNDDDDRHSRESSENKTNSRQSCSQTTTKESPVLERTSSKESPLIQQNNVQSVIHLSLKKRRSTNMIQEQGYARRQVDSPSCIDVRPKPKASSIVSLPTTTTASKGVYESAPLADSSATGRRLARRQSDLPDHDKLSAISLPVSSCLVDSSSEMRRNSWFRRHPIKSSRSPKLSSVVSPEESPK